MSKVVYKYLLYLILTGTSSGLFAQGFTLAGGGQAQDSSFDFSYSIGNVFYNSISQGSYVVIPGTQYRVETQPSWINPTAVSSFRIFPNPSNGILEIVNEGSELGDNVSYTITDMLGRKVMDYNVGVLGSGRLDISHLPPAQYQLHIYQNNTIQSSIKIQKY